jgi:uncharacterized damage-inducible protein DinB
MEQNQINLMIYMLEDIRKITLAGVRGLTKEQLFTPPAAGEYPIGAYLMHLGEAELGWLETLSGEKQPEELMKRAYGNAWFDPVPGQENPPTKPIEVDEYLNTLAEIRQRLKNYMLTLNDSELDDVITRGKDKISKKWMIYHLIEHEAHTRGQMFLLMRIGGLKKKSENNRLD